MPSIPSTQTQLVPLETILHDLVVSRHPSRAGEVEFHAILEVSATNYTLKAEDEQASMIAGYRRLLRALTFPLQILVCAQRMDLSSYVKSLDAAHAHPQLGRFARAHQRDMRDLGTRRTLIERRFYVILPARDAATSSWPTLLLNLLPGVGKRRQRAHLQERATKARELLSTRCALVQRHLAGMGLTSRQLSGQELLLVHHRSLRGQEGRVPAPRLEDVDHLPQRVEASSSLEESQTTRERPPAIEAHEALPLEGQPPTQSEREQPVVPEEQALLAPLVSRLADLLAPESLIISPDALRVGDDYLCGLAVVGFPREVTDGWLLPLLQLDAIMDLTFHLTPQPKAAVLRHLMLRKAQYASTRRVNQRRGQQEDPELHVAESDVDAMIGRIASGEETMLTCSFYLLVRASSLEDLKEQSARVLSVLHHLLLSAHKTTLEHLATFRSCQPCARDPLGRSLTMSSTVLSTMFPFVSDLLAMPNGIFLGVTPNGEPVILDPWDVENPHEFFGGLTGAGKSYMIKLRILHELLRSRPQVIVIDPAYEYHRLAQECGGTVIRIAPGSPHCINPFDLLPAGPIEMQAYVERTTSDRLAEKIQKLHVLLDLMLSDYTPHPTMLSSREKALLDRALYEVYRRVGITADPRTHDRPAPLLRDLYEVLRSDVAGHDRFGLAERLERYVLGSLSGLFQQQSTVDLAGSLLVFDIREMSGSSELRPIGIFLIADFVWTQALFQRKPRRLYIDEAWSLIEHIEGGRFLEKMAREARKYYLSLVTITQNPEKFIEDPRGSVIAQNALTKVLKRLDAVGSQAAREAFGLTTEEERLLLTLPQQQALLLIGTKRMIVEIHANEQEHALMTTKPSELEDDPPPALQQSATRKPPRRTRAAKERPASLPQTPGESPR